MAALDWSDRDGRLSAGSRRPFDEARARDLATREFKRAINPQNMLSHAMIGDEKGQARFAEIPVPFLVAHRTDDPIPVMALAAAVVMSLGAALGLDAGAAEIKTAQAPAGTYHFRMPTSLSASDPYIVRQKQMIARIKERKNGAIVITMYPSDSLMRPDDVPKALGAGTVEMDSVGVSSTTASATSAEF